MLLGMRKILVTLQRVLETRVGFTFQLYLYMIFFNTIILYVKCMKT